MKKEVLKSTRAKKKNKIGLIQVLHEIENGNNPAKISKKYNIPKQTISNYTRKLKKMGALIKLGYGTWEVRKQVLLSTKATKIKPNICRGHGFVWRIRFKHEIDWMKRLTKLKMTYKLVGIKSTPRIIVNNKKIWLGKRSVVIYEPQSFFADNSIISKSKAVWELEKTVRKLESMFNLMLRPYEFKVSREHYALIKNELARQYNDKNEKLFIRDDKGLWMWIDFSHRENELENNEVMVNKQVQDFWNDNKKHNFKVTATFVLNQFSNLIEDRKFWAEHQKSHVKSIQQLGNSAQAGAMTTELIAEKVADLSEQIVKLKEILEKNEKKH